MIRYEGLLRPQSRPAPWPSRWVYVATCGETIPVADRPRLRATGLERWLVRVVEYRGAEPQCQESASGRAAGALWEWLESVASRAGLTWVLSPRALQDWTLLGLWERLLLGDLQIANLYPVRRRPAPDVGLGRDCGLLLTGDPPSAAALLIGRGKRRVTWVCAANYGWGDIAQETEARERIERVAAAVADTSRALERHRLGGWCPTVGSMGMRAWRSQHMKESIYVDRNESVGRLSDAARVGGRVVVSATISRVHRGYWLDARSLYPRIIEHQRVPVGLRGYADAGHTAGERVRASAHQCIARVQLRNSQGRFPARTLAGVEYPQGDTLTTLCGPELELAFREGCVEEVYEHGIFNVGNPLGDYMRACYRLRCEAESDGRPHVATLAKAMANAVVGKLHGYEEQWEEVIPDYNDPICGSWIGPDGKGGQTQYRAVAGQVSRRRRIGLSATAVPAIPLWTWSYGRVWLLSRMEVCGMREVLYADTDGLVVTEQGRERLAAAGLIRDNVWGELRLVAGPVDVEIMGPKCIRIGGEIIAAGQPKSQRSSDYAAQGYWYRSPFGGAAKGYAEGKWVEEWRDRGAG